MRKLVINKDDIERHKATYSAPIEEILGLLKDGMPVYRISQKKTKIVWLEARSPKEKKFYGEVLELYRKGNFLTMELGGLVDLCKEFDKLYKIFPKKKLVKITLSSHKGMTM